jgi:hypothetical protein
LGTPLYGNSDGPAFTKLTATGPDTALAWDSSFFIFRWGTDHFLLRNNYLLLQVSFFPFLTNRKKKKAIVLYDRFIR